MANSIMDTPLGEDVRRILASKSPSSGFYKMEMTILSKAGLAIKPTKIHEHLLRRNFLEGVGDVIQMVIDTSRSDYEYLIMPNRRDLEVELSIAPCNSNGDNPGTAVKARYTAQLIDVQDNLLTGGSASAPTLTDKTQQSVSFSIKLIESDLNQLYGTMVSTVTYDHTAQELIEVFASNMGKYPIAVYPPDNKATQPALVIPYGTNAFEIANWLQNEGGGVYNNGCGTYFLNGWIFVYPTYLAEPSQGRPRHIILRGISSDFMGITNTYAVSDGVTYILSSGQGNYKDVTEALESNAGNAIAFADPRYWGNRVTHDNGDAAFENSGFTVIANNERKVNNITVVNRNTVNGFRERSRLAERNGAFLAIPWDHPNPALIKPNTEVEIHYVDAGKRFTKTGVIVKYDQESKAVEKRGTSSIFKTSGVLTILLSQNV